MKVAIVCPYDLGHHGGVQDQAIRLTRWLSDLDHEVLLVGPGEEGPDGSLLIGRTRHFTANRANTPITLDPRTAKQLRAAVADVDVVHVHEPFMPVISATATLIRNLPTVGTFHADPPTWARRGYRVGAPLWRRAVRRLDVVTTVSKVAESAISPFASARVIPNGIDVDRYGNEEKVPNRIAFLGRDDERKGLQVLLDAWPSVLGAIPEAELRVIGADRDVGVEGVRFLGRTSEDEKIAELSAAEIYCAPNLGGESFGIVVAEGMASSCAVVASAIPAFVNVLSDTGALVPPGDADALGATIIDLLEDRDRLISSQRAARTAVDRFDGSLVAARYVAAYEAAIAQHRS